MFAMPIGHCLRLFFYQYEQQKGILREYKNGFLHERKAFQVARKAGISMQPRLFLHPII